MFKKIISYINNQNGIAQLAVIGLILTLIASVGLTTYLVQQRTNILPFAAEPSVCGGSACTQCILNNRGDLLSFYQSNGWDVSCGNQDSIINNWCSIDPQACSSIKAGACANACGASAPSASISLNPSTIAYDGSTTVTWSTANIPSGSSCTHNWNFTLNDRPPNTSGTDVRANLRENYTFTIACTNGTTASAALTVGPPPAPAANVWAKSECVGNRPLNVLWWGIPAGINSDNIFITRTTDRLVDGGVNNIPSWTEWKDWTETASNTQYSYSVYYHDTRNGPNNSGRDVGFGPGWSAPANVTVTTPNCSASQGAVPTPTPTPSSQSCNTSALNSGCPAGLVCEPICVGQPTCSLTAGRCVQPTATPVPTPTPAPAPRIPIYRLINSARTGYFWASPSERNNLTAGNAWVSEGPVWSAYALLPADNPPTIGLPANLISIYRLISSDRSRYFWATPTEKNNLTAGNAWVSEGPIFSAFATEQPGTVPIYRLINSSRTAYFWANPTEKNNLTATNQWVSEGPVWYAYADADTSSCRPSPQFTSGALSTSSVAQGQTFNMTCNFSNTNTNAIFPNFDPGISLDTSFANQGCRFDGFTNGTSTFTANFTCKAGSCPNSPLPVSCTIGKLEPDLFCDANKTKIGDLTITGTAGPGCNPPPTSPPTPPPAVYTTHYKISETEAGLAGAELKPYTEEPVITNYTLLDKNPGPKQIWVEYISSIGTSRIEHINLTWIEPDPSVASVSCDYDISRENIKVSVTGSKFGSSSGRVSVDGKDIEILEWKDGKITALLKRPNLSTQDTKRFKIQVLFPDGKIITTAPCEVGASILYLGARLFCREEGKFDTENVKVTVVDEGKSKVEETVSIDKDGVIKNLKTKLQSGKRYGLSIKAPKSVRRNLFFTATDGTTIVTNPDGSQPILPVGDIAPVIQADGKINTLDRAELTRQWRVFGSSVKSQTGDLKIDSKVNSFDWACMRYDFNAFDDPILTEIPQNILPTPITNPPVNGCFNDSECSSGFRCSRQVNLPYPGRCLDENIACSQVTVVACNNSNPTECVEFGNACLVPPGWTVKNN